MSSTAPPSYQRRGSSAYQNVPSIYNDSQSDNALDTNDNNVPAASASDSESVSFLSSSSPTMISSVFEPREDLGKRNTLYITGVIFAFFVLMSLVSHNGGGDGQNVTSAASSDVQNNGNQNSNAWDKTPIVYNDQMEDSTSTSSSSSSTTANNENEKTSQNDSSSSNSSPGGVSLAYLLSYPRSGNTFTTNLIAALAQAQSYTSNNSNSVGVSSAIATNYREQCATDENGNVYPVYKDVKEGPCYIKAQPNSQSNQNENDSNNKSSSNEKYVVTISHCAGRCPYASFNCPPSDYIETYESFESACRTTSFTSISFLSSSSSSSNNNSTTTTSTYPSSLIQKVIHLYRNPLDNIVSQYNKAHKEYKHKSDDASAQKWLLNFPKSKEGFQKWCATNYTSFLPSSSSSSYEKENSDAAAALKYLTQDVIELFPQIPCADEFYRYVQFHNYVSQVVEYRSYSSLKIFYENYKEEDEWNVATSLFSFLEYDNDDDNDDVASVVSGMVKEDKLPVFYEGNGYEEYFTEEQKEAVWRLIRAVAHPRVWKDLAYYYNA